MLIQGFETTAASLRGVQLLGSIRGKREDQKIFAGTMSCLPIIYLAMSCHYSCFRCLTDTLVDKHQFFDSLQDTVTIHSKLGDTV